MRLFMIAVLAGAIACVACDGGSSVATRTPASSVTSPTLRTTVVPTGTALPPSSTATASPAGATSTPAASGESGIDGAVTIGPTCPVQRADSPCPDRPYEATIAVLQAGREVARTRSDSSGDFRLLLPPGTYTIRPEQSGVPPTARDQTVDVVRGRFTDVQIVFDSGIR